MGHRSSSVSWQFDTSSVYPGLIECFGCLLQHTLIRGWPTTGWSDLGACHMVVSRGPFAVHTVFHINQSQWMLLSVLVASSFISFLQACPLIPNSFRSLMVELATKPLQPTSNRSTLTSHPLSSASANKLAYRSLFFSFTSSVPSFQEFVSSTMKAHRQELDEKIWAQLVNTINIYPQCLGPRWHCPASFFSRVSLCS